MNMSVVIRLIPEKLLLRERISFLIKGFKLIIKSIIYRDYLALDLGLGDIDTALHGYLYKIKFENASLTDTTTGEKYAWLKENC